ncbi:hypothetical protein ACWDV4_08535 [Micromonospora sp. NPDC003197]
MSTGSSWRDVKTKARVLDPTWDSEERTQRRAGMRAEMIASVSESRPAEPGEQLGTPDPTA